MSRVLYILNRNQISLSSSVEWRQAMPSTGAILFTDDSDVLNEKQLKDDYGFENVVSFDNFQASSLVEFEACRLHSISKFEKIITLGEFDIERAARIRSALSIKGQKISDGLAFRDKFCMRLRLLESGFNCPRFSKIDNYCDLKLFIDEIGFPLVFKERCGAGSKGLVFLKNEADVEALLQGFTSGLPEGKYLVESFVQGEMYHIDGLVVEGKPVVCLPSKYADNAANSDFSVALCSVSVEGESASALRSFTEDVINRAFPSTDSYVFHLEVFVDRGAFTVCEIACRLGGARIKDAVILRTGLDLKMLFLNGEALGWNRQKIHIATGRDESCRFVGWAMLRQREGTLDFCPTEVSVPGVSRIKLRQPVGSQFNAPRESVDHYVSYLVEGANELEVTERMNAAKIEITEKTVWRST